MLRYFIEGGPLFMGILTIVFLAVFVMAIVFWLSIRTGKLDATNSKLDYLKSLGLFAFVLGMLGQFLGLFQAFDIIGQGMEVSPRIFAMGLKVSSITNIYGMIIFLVAYLLWFVLKASAGQKD